ncbi:MAG: 16S rRNA (guanine(527)-N(7))-methyltransferase RsmG [Clostridia bacterium]
MNEKLLSDGLKALAIQADAGFEAKLERYIAAIEAWNPAYGLVGATGDELVIKHILDSLAPLAVINRLLAGMQGVGHTGHSPSVAEPPSSYDRQFSGSEGLSQNLADLGTGAGLPGIPLALARPDIEVALIDRMTRRIHFLEAMQAELPLPNVTIIEEQVERAKGSYDIVTFRAFRPFERKLFRKVFGICAPGGYVVAYKGKADRAEAELESIAGLYTDVQILPVQVPFLVDERCLVVMRPAVKPQPSAPSSI